MFGESPDEEVPPELRHRSFSHKPTWARFLIVFAGPAFNFVFALFVFWLMFAIQGVPHLSPTVGKVQPNMPAEAAGIQPGDVIVSIGDQSIRYWDDVLDGVRDAGGRNVNMVIQRSGNLVTMTLQPQLVPSKNIFGEDIQIPMIGIEVRGEMVVQRINPISALYYGVVRTWDLTKLTILSVVKLIQGTVSPKTLGGPIFIAQLAGEQARAGILNLIFLAALLSVNLGILNLLPVPILDGGHLFFFVVEMIFRRPVSLRIRERAQQAGFVILMMLMVFIFYNDLARIFGGGTMDPSQPAAVEQHDSTGPGNGDSDR